jgi:hypothetical protein
MYHKKNDDVLFEMEKLRRTHAIEIGDLFDRLNSAIEETQFERFMRQEAEQNGHIVIDSAQSQATTIVGGEQTDPHLDREIMSPVSVAPPTPRRQEGQHTQHTPILDPETPESTLDDEESREDEDEYEKDPAAFWKKEFPRWSEVYQQHQEDEAAYQDYYGNYGNRDMRSTPTTDCSGDPMYNSDLD